MIKLKNILNEEQGPCWKGYQQVGMKDKGGKQVPNCVPESVGINEVVSKTFKIPTQRGTLHIEVEEDQAGVFVDVIFNNVDITMTDIQFPTGEVKITQKQKRVNLKEGSTESVIREAGIPKLYLKIEAVKNEIDRLTAERKSKYGGEYAKKLNAEKDPKKREQLKQPILAISQKITKLQSNLADMYEKEEKYYANMGKDDELDPNFA